MCIAIISTAHPDYPIILLNNRDEFLSRPTDPAKWWPNPDNHILGGRDLLRAEHGTWLGITKQGRLACLTNFREQGADANLVQGRRSRGAMVNAYLRVPQSTGKRSGEIAKELIEEGTAGVGGFSLLFGLLRRPTWGPGGKKTDGDVAVNRETGWDGMAIVSNRSASIDDVKWLCTGPGETHALSNSHYGDTTWPKVISGEQLVAAAIEESVAKQESVDQLRQRLLEVLSQDTLPKMKDGEVWTTYLLQLRNSIFIPSIGSDEQRDALNSNLPNQGEEQKAKVYSDSVTTGLYGTQKQTIVMVDWSGKATCFERTLYDNNVQAVDTPQGDASYEFQVQNWAD